MGCASSSDACCGGRADAENPSARADPPHFPTATVHPALRYAHPQLHRDGYESDASCVSMPATVHSRGDVCSERGPVARSFEVARLVLSARLRHGINARPDQYDPGVPDPAVVDRARTIAELWLTATAPPAVEQHTQPHEQPSDDGAPAGGDGEPVSRSDSPIDRSSVTSEHALAESLRRESDPPASRATPPLSAVDVSVAAPSPTDASHVSPARRPAKERTTTVAFSGADEQSRRTHENATPTPTTSSATASKACALPTFANPASAADGGGSGSVASTLEHLDRRAARLNVSTLARHQAMLSHVPAPAVAPAAPQ
eukprot:CAMPEP_0174843244 /NCGR_PEP_ID=MMETSP1114-20130205/10391_1 /TAXON_ID=312471 /ORGANISM="Neobodo designis, Strain CCAP 1951/1" /LENGTH=315 /DNA_ID=CAMNT_0016077459 /DNA_START=408 /DNA_END=1355 /DNA_ORIENTATION=+